MVTIVMKMADAHHTGISITYKNVISYRQGEGSYLALFYFLFP